MSYKHKPAAWKADLLKRKDQGPPKMVGQPIFIRCPGARAGETFCGQGCMTCFLIGETVCFDCGAWAGQIQTNMTNGAVISLCMPCYRKRIQ